MAVADNVELVWLDPVVPAGPARVDIMLDGELVGDLDYRLCTMPTCQIGVMGLEEHRNGNWR